MLALDMVDSQNAADEYLQNRGIEQGRRRGFTDSLYSFLAEAPRTQVEMYEFIRKNGSDKAWNNRKLHEKVRDLTVRLHVDLTGCPFKEEMYVEPQEETQNAA